MRLAVEVNVEGVRSELAVPHALLHDVGIARRRREGRKKVFVSEELIVDRSRLDHSGPADERGHAIATLKVRGFLTAIGRASAVGPGHYFRAVVGGVNDDGVVGDTEVFELLQ